MSYKAYVPEVLLHNKEKHSSAYISKTVRPVARMTCKIESLWGSLWVVLYIGGDL